jgi:hypothetical protein
VVCELVEAATDPEALKRAMLAESARLLKIMEKDGG